MITSALDSRHAESSPRGESYQKQVTTYVIEGISFYCDILSGGIFVCFQENEKAVNDARHLSFSFIQETPSNRQAKENSRCSSVHMRNHAGSFVLCLLGFHFSFGRSRFSNMADVLAALTAQDAAGNAASPRASADRNFTNLWTQRSNRYQDGSLRLSRK